MGRRPDGEWRCWRSGALEAAAIVFALTLAAGCDAGADEPPSLAEIEAFIGTPLPPNVRDLHVADEAGIDRLMRLRFDAPEKEALDFAESLVPDGREAGADPGLLSMGSDIGWWLDAMPPGARGGAGVSNANCAYKPIIAPAGRHARRVWLAVFTQ